MNCSIPLLAACLATASACAQLQVQTPYPTGRNLGGVAFDTPTHGFVVGENHTLVETFDGGETWIRRMGTGFSTDPFYTITNAGSGRFYLAGNNTDAYRSTDAGQTWTQMTSFPFGSARVLDFITPTTGFVGLNGAICYTPDGGISWPLRSGYPDCPIMFGMDFRDANFGIAAGIRSTPHNDGGLYRTTDGGRTWAHVLDTPANDVLWLDDLAVIAVGGQDVLRSDDEGRTWYTLSFGGLTTGASSVARAGQSNILGAVSGVGDIWYSTDLGASWFQVVQGIGVLPANWDITFVDEFNGYVVGANGLAYRTGDAGFSWELVNNGCGDEVTAIDFAPGDTFGVGVTHRGFLFRTDDRGQRWHVTRLRETGVVFGREEGFRTVDVLDEQNILAAGAGGIVFRSFDGGASWLSLGFPFSIPGNYEARDVQFVDAFNAWLVGFGDDVSMYRTTDGGFSWNPVAGPAGSLVAVDFEGERVWTATAGSRVHRSFDGGETWAFADIPGDAYGIADMEFIDANTGWVVGWYGTMAKTTNGGLSWTRLTQPQNETFLDVEIVSPSEMYVVGYDNSTFRYFYKRSTNAGVSWTRTTINGHEEWFTRIHVRPAGRFWLAGSAGKILYSPAPPLSITLPENTPAQVPPGTPVSFPVRVVAGEQEVLPGSPTLWVRRSTGEEFQGFTLEQGEGGTYTATIPPMSCADTPQYYITASGSAGAEVRSPASAPATYASNVGVFENEGVVLSADFNDGLPAGWSATGLWHLTTACAPPGAGNCGSGARAYFGQDSTCNFNTGQRVSGILRSPQITLPALQPGQAIRVSFCSALDTEYPDNAYGDDDQAQLWFVFGSQQAPLEWFTDHAAARTRTIDMSHHAGRTGRLEWRFDSMNTYMNGYRGWHVDNVRVTAPQLVCDDACAADFNADGGVTSQDFFDFLTAFFAGDADVNGDGSTNSQDFFDFIGVFFAGCG